MIYQGIGGPCSWSGDELCQGYQLLQKLHSKEALPFHVDVDE